jgi:hypothetical protein
VVLGHTARHHHSGWATGWVGGECVRTGDRLVVSGMEVVCCLLLRGGRYSVATSLAHFASTSPHSTVLL